MLYTLCSTNIGANLNGKCEYSMLVNPHGTIYFRADAAGG